MRIFGGKRRCKASSAQTNDNNKTVLVVEDNRANMELFHAMLHNGGHTVVEAKNGFQAMELAAEHRPDLIVMDIQLPWVSGRCLSGLDVTRWLKRNEELREIPVVIVTAFAVKEEEDKILAAGCDDYLFKPVDVSLFQETVRPYLN